MSEPHLPTPLVVLSNDTYRLVLIKHGQTPGEQRPIYRSIVERLGRDATNTPRWEKADEFHNDDPMTSLAISLAKEILRTKL